jgi:hypothetical protein
MLSEADILSVASDGHPGDLSIYDMGLSLWSSWCFNDPQDMGRDTGTQSQHFTIEGAGATVAGFSTTCGSPSVTCTFTVDNFVTKVFHNGVEVTNTVTEDLTDWTIPKTLTFYDVPHATIEILAEDEATGADGCAVSGLLMRCVGGSWDGFESNTGALVQTFGSDTAFTIGTARAASLGAQCTSTSAFNLGGFCTSCTKIWPSNGAQ